MTGLLILSAWLLASQQQPNLAIADNLLVEGIPPIPASIAEGVRRYTEFRGASLNAWNPKRREMLIGTRFGDTGQIHRVKFPGGDRSQLTFFPEGARGASYDPNDENTFLFTSDVGGAENFQFFRYDVSTGASTLITDGKSRNEGRVWSEKSSRILYTSTRRTGKDNDFYVMDPKHPETDHLVAKVSGGGWQPLDWSPDDKQGLVKEEKSINESYLWLLDFQSGQLTPITPHPAAGSTAVPVAYGSAAFSKDGKRLILTTDQGSEFVRLGSIDLTTKVFKAWTADIPWDIEDVALTRDRQKIAFLSNNAGFSVLHVCDPVTGRHHEIPQLPGGVISGVQWSADGTEIGFGLSSAQTSTDVFSVNPTKRRLTRWTESETGGINTANFATPELVKWKAADGKEISGFLYTPPKKFGGKRPLIINIHGGPEGQTRGGFIGRNNYWLNELGVAILFPNVRGSSGYGKTFLKLDNGFLREDSYKDIGSLLDYIQTRSDLDSEHVMITGGSYGGHMTFAMSYLYANRIACSLPVVGMSNLATFLENTSGYRQDLRRAEYGDERDPKMREFLNRIAPRNHSAEITKPIFVVQGKNDPRVPFSEAQSFVDKIKSTNRNVWYLVAKDEGHGFAKKKNVDFQFYATVLFVQRYLLGQ